MRRLLLYGFIVSCFVLRSINAFAQNTFVTNVNDSSQKKVPHKVVIKKPKPLSKEFSIGLRLNTDGWSIFADKGKVKSEERESDKFYNIRLLQLEFGEHKHAKEIKSTNRGPTYADKPRPYKFGKINNFYTLKLGYGYRRMIAGKPDPGTVSIHWVYAGGLAIGLLKPYYLDVYTQNGVEPIKYSENPNFFVPEPIDQARIVGRSSLLTGIGETKIIPGIHAKTALHFDFAASKKTKLAIETGINVELYIKKIEIMANVKAHPYVLNGYVAFQFGKRK